MRLGLITCGEGVLVGGVHTLVGGVAAGLPQNSGTVGTKKMGGRYGRK